ncbi:glutathionylspermidine synthase family protein [Oleisolibacter albus]|uniref:glutathionylspermidine synthase family protein n=1 Tax=Oleisolibacter albus TaxID=2171757 RepID=UPI000DF1E028|nr:glutathionylspermidine synthase family protein [Oleisolibacter albus]
MQRVSNAPRPAWTKRVEQELGFTFHSPGGDPYWTEDAHYRFTADEIDTLEAAATELHKMCLEACKHVVNNRLYAELGIPPHVIPAVERSWARFAAGRGEAPIYGRFDLVWNGTGAPVMLEYNAATPTSLYESAVVQWHWLEEFAPDQDQFNSLHEALVARWRAVAPMLGTGRVHFTAQQNPEDMGTADYMRICAVEAGLAGKLIDVASIQYDQADRCFYDADGERISVLWSLYPHEWFILDEAGGPSRLMDAILEDRITLLEPIWKIMLTKGILPILWELYPHHPYLLKASFRAADFRPGSKVVAKPIWGREGDGVEIAEIGADGRPSRIVEKADRSFAGDEGWVYQDYVDLPDFGGGSMILGGWIIGDEACGLGVREDPSSLITGNDSRYIPHLFEPAAEE